MFARAALLKSIREIGEAARSQAARSVNTALVLANWLIGKQIVEAEQGGEARAAYSRQLLATLSSSLEKGYGSGFSVSALQYMRAFFLGYPRLLEIQHAVRVVSPEAPAVAWKPGSLHPALSWTHYRALLKVDRRDARDFYEPTSSPRPRSASTCSRRRRAAK